MSDLYKFESAAENVPLFLQEAYALARAVRADPLNREHVEPALGLTGCVNKALQGAGVQVTTSENLPETLDECCARVMAICDSHKEGQAAFTGGALWAMLAPILARLVVRLLDRVL